MTTTTQNPAPTALMPLDPAVSPQQALRILPIRANLLPGEITAGRNVRRVRTILIFAMVLVVGGLGGWFMYAAKERDLADEDLAAVSRQVNSTRNETRADKYTKVTSAIEQRDTITTQLETAMGDDLPWETLLKALRESGVRGVTVSSIVGNVMQDAAGTAATAGTATATTTATRKVGSLTITGTATDKKTIAAYLEKIAKARGVADVFLTTASSGGATWSFSIMATISSDRLCGRFTTSCKSGG